MLYYADDPDGERRMLYRPNYCSNCGEKIERVDWGILTSRRFCGICETEFKGHEVLVRSVVGIALLIGVVGIGAYLRSDSPTESAVVRQLSKLVEKSAQPEVKPRPTESLANAKSPDPAANAQVQQLAAPRQTPVKVEIAEAQYFCGAETKKGTPCSRRVKGNTRCYQHAGMPAMINSERSKN